MTRYEDLPEIIELEAEIEEFMKKLYAAEDKDEFELYRQMIKVNINMIKALVLLK